MKFTKRFVSDTHIKFLLVIVGAIMMLEGVDILSQNTLYDGLNLHLPGVVILYCWAMVYLKKSPEGPSFWEMFYSKGFNPLRALYSTVFFVISATIIVPGSVFFAAFAFQCVVVGPDDALYRMASMNPAEIGVMWRAAASCYAIAVSCFLLISLFPTIQRLKYSSNT